MRYLAKRWENIPICHPKVIPVKVFVLEYTRILVFVWAEMSVYMRIHQFACGNLQEYQQGYDRIS